MYEIDINDADKYTAHKQIDGLERETYSATFFCSFCDHDLVIKNPSQFSKLKGVSIFKYLDSQWQVYYYFCPFCGKTYRAAFCHGIVSLQTFVELCWENEVNEETSDTDPLLKCDRSGTLFVKETHIPRWI